MLPPIVVGGAPFLVFPKGIHPSKPMDEHGSGGQRNTGQSGGQRCTMEWHESIAHAIEELHQKDPEVVHKGE